MLGEEIIFNFDNLIFLVISIGSWGFVLVRGMSTLKRKNKSPKVFPQVPQFRFPTHSCPFGSSGQESVKIINLKKITSPVILHLPGIRTY